ncbi:MAG: hypothetical protein ACJ746_28155 [Bryobacteraceae bacterium]
MACLLLTAASSAFAQRISVGIKAGVPLTDVVESVDTHGGDLTFQAQTKRYTIGPVVDIGLPLGFGVEFGAMYKRVDQKSRAVTITGFTTMGDTSVAIEQRADISAVGHSWEFPVAVQYHFSKSSIRPYVEGGISFNHLGNVYNFSNVYNVANASFPSPTPRQPPYTVAPIPGSFERVGGLVGIGVDFKLHVIHVTPGLRYTHYNEKSFWLPSTNAVDFLVGFTF